jgi:membrane protease YdiL (CAAX protease family)
MTGLFVAWGGTALLVSPLARTLDDPSRLPLALLGQALFWALAAVVLAFVLFWEKKPIRSLWLQQFRWRSVFWGLFLVAAYYLILLPSADCLRRAAGLPGFAAGMDRLTKFPVWYRTVAVIGAGITEEILFRGFTVTRLAMITGNVWFAGILTLIGFYGLHVPFWGWGFAAGGALSGLGAMLFFLWRKDLLAMMIFHITTDAIGIVIAPLFSEWWKNPALL